MESDHLLRLLTIFDSSEEAELHLNALRKAGHIVRDIRVADAEDMQLALDENPIDLILCKLLLPGFSAKRALAVLNNAGLEIPLIAISPGTGTETEVMELLRAGARDVLSDSQVERLKHVIQREMDNLKQGRALRKCELMLHETEKRARDLIDSSRDAIAYVHDGMHIFANHTYLKMFGYDDPDDIQGTPIMDLVSVEDYITLKEFLRGYAHGKSMDRTLDVHGQHLEGKQFKITMEFSPASMEGEACTQIIIRELSRSRELEKKLNAMSRQDLLTGLYNQGFLIEQMEQLIAHAIEGQARGALLYIMLDKYEELREAKGISTADMLLTEVAAMLKSQAEDLGLLARFSGPVITLLVNDTDVKDAAGIAKSLGKLIHEHICDLGEQSVTTTASIGISLINETSSGSDDVIKRAEKGCHVAMDEGGNRYHLYNPAIVELAEHERLSHWSRKIKHALKNNLFHLVFQPIVSLHGEAGEYYEVRLRMLTEKQAEILPGEFISAAEQAGMMNLIDRWVIIHSLMLLSKLQREGKQTRFFVKLSSDSLRDKAFLPWLNDQLKTSGVNPGKLVFEISEDSALNHLKQTIALLHSLQELNCGTALENFGMEANIFQSLKHLHVNYIKLHIDLIRNLTQNIDHQEMVKAISEEAGTHDMQTIAAFVEDANSLAILWQCRINFIQGHFLQHPELELNYDFDEVAG